MRTFPAAQTILQPLPITSPAKRGKRSSSTVPPAARCASDSLPSAIPSACAGSRSTRWCGPAKAARPLPSGASACRNIAPPTGLYIDMSANLPILDPERISVPTLVMRGQWDGIAAFQDLSNFFGKLPNPDKQFIVMPGIAHTSTRSKNWRLVYHLLDGYFSQPPPVYTGQLR